MPRCCLLQRQSGPVPGGRSADVEYLVLNLDSVAQGLVVSDADIAAYYQQNADRYASKEERRAATS